MNSRNRPVLLILGVAFGLSACAGGQKGGGRPATIQPVSDQAKMSDAMAWLNAGDAKSAKATLNAMLRRNPRDESAIILLDSIDRDPADMLGAKAFDYMVKPGDTLISISQRFLGSSLKFYALARYNGIAVPSSLAAGSGIRVPGEAPSVAPPPPPKPKSARPRATEPTMAKPDTAPRPPAPSVEPARASRLRGAGLAALNKGQVATAVGLLRQAAALDPANPLIRRDLDRAQRIRQTVKSRR